MTYLIVYLTGVIAALAVMRDPWPARITTALVWPLGPVAFVLVIAILLVASAILWPMLGVAAAALIAAVIYLVGC